MSSKTRRIPLIFVFLGIIAIIPAIILTLRTIGHANSTDDFYFAFQIFLVQRFPFSILIVTLFLAAIYGLSYFVMREYNDIHTGKSFYKGNDSFFGFTIVSGLFIFIFIVFCITAVLRYAGTSVQLEYGCPLGEMLGLSCKKSYGTLREGIGGLGSLVYPLAFIVLSAYTTFVVVLTIPLWGAVLVSLTTSHPARDRVERSVGHKRPDPEIERSLAMILTNYHSGDAREVDRLLNELSPIKRWVWRTRAKKHQREAERLEKIVRAQTDKMRADEGLAKSVHDSERARRER